MLLRPLSTGSARPVAVTPLIALEASGRAPKERVRYLRLAPP